MKTKKILLLTLLAFLYTESYSVQFLLSVENQVVSGNYVTFDLYIKTTAPADTLFLASSSWGWTYNNANFTNPTFTVIEGYSTNLKSREGIEVGELFYVLTANAPNGNKITGDISGPDPQTLANFNQRVARITNQPSFHRIGRYKVSGITNLNGTLNLQWFLPYCAIWQYQTQPPYNTEQLTGNYAAIPVLALPVENNGTVIPDRFDLKQNYPNPFNPVTQIIFDVPAAAKVNIKVYDETGKLMAELVNDVYQAGSYKTDFDGRKLASGIYFYKMTSGEYTMVRKMVLVK